MRSENRAALAQPLAPITPPTRDASRAQDASLDASLAAAERWLCSNAVVSPDGAVRSWAHPVDRASGYPYPEAGGLWLALPGLGAAEQRGRVAGWLADEIRSAGAAGRGDRLYLFDSAIVLNGLVVHGDPAHADAMQHLYGFIAARVADRRGVTGAPGTRWSLTYGSHLLKAAIALHRYADLTGQDAPREVAACLERDLLQLFDGRRFVTHEGSALSYHHGAIYALEGLAYLTDRGLADHGAPLRDAASWIATIQRPDGGIPAFCNGDRAYGPARGDVAAQAVRIWRIVDPDRFAAPIAAALAFLADLEAPGGGLRYEPESSDVNTWVTLFAAQAWRWSRDGDADAGALF